jgi:hypothetical protein
MSKKHFIALADTIKTSASTYTSDQIGELANFCQSQNRNFNRERWIAYIKGECGPNGGKR